MNLLTYADATALDKFIEILKVLVLGIVEGITEWLPVSSTGHMILIDEFLHLRVSRDFREMFLVVIQLGAILAVPVLFWERLVPFSRKKSDSEKKQTYSLWLKVIVGVIPAAVLGFLLDDLLDTYLYNFVTVAIALAVYGVAFIIVEKLRKNRVCKVESVYDLTYRDALLIGGFQCLSLIPGTSRSGSTILGGMIGGVSRSAASEFSFFMAIPVMLGASGLKILKFFIERGCVKGFEWLLLGLGILISFLVSLVTIRFLMEFVKGHSFVVFGIYRIALGILVLLYFLIA